jgi:hypothetical protein
MPLSTDQILNLASEIGAVWNVPKQTLFAADLDVDLATTIDPGDGTPKKVALAFISHMNSRTPPRDGELLEALQARGTARLRTISTELLTPSWFSPTNDALGAIAIGKTAFIARPRLRSELQGLRIPSPATTRVLIVRGEQPGGKSYSFEFLRHFARNVVGATPMRLQLKDLTGTPRQFLDIVFASLGLVVDTSTVVDDPQLSVVRPVIATFKNKIEKLDKTYWLIIDDLNDPRVTPPVRETAFALAETIEEQRSDHLWVALLGYNQEVGAELRNVAQDDAAFPTRELVAQFYVSMASRGPSTLTLEEAEVYANAAFSGFEQIDKAAMMQLTPIIEEMGAKLSDGLRPQVGP